MLIRNRGISLMWMMAALAVMPALAFGGLEMAADMAAVITLAAAAGPPLAPPASAAVRKAFGLDLTTTSHERTSLQQPLM